jgi:two-component system heavy metal sensor histidine kinase CusS
VVVRIAPEAEHQLRVEVENAGETIAPQHLPRLFDRFFRADAARHDGQSHHGLGLAIVAAIARMHAGKPVAESAGGRTRVGFTLLQNAAA